MLLSVETPPVIAFLVGRLAFGEGAVQLEINATGRMHTMPNVNQQGPVPGRMVGAVTNSRHGKNVRISTLSVRSSKVEVAVKTTQSGCCGSAGVLAASVTCETL